MGTREPMSIGWEGAVHPQLFPFTLQEKLDCITEFHPWFSKEAGSASPWGRAILPPECLNAVMLGGRTPMVWPDRPQDDWIRQASKGATPVGLFGGCEVVLHAGPVFVDEEY